MVWKTRLICKQYEETKLKPSNNEVLSDLRKELKTYMENHFKGSCHKTSRWHTQNDDDSIVPLKEKIKYLKGNLWKNNYFLNLIRSCKSSSSSLKENWPWLPVDASSRFYFWCTSEVLQHKHTDSKRIKKQVLT